MKPPLVLKAGNDLIPFRDVARVDIAQIEEEVVNIYTHGGSSYCAQGFDAIEAIMILRPSAMEGQRLRWKKHAWAFHNIVGHPLMQFMAWMGLGRAAVRFHDWTTPRPRGGR